MKNFGNSVFIGNKATLFNSYRIEEKCSRNKNLITARSEIKGISKKKYLKSMVFFLQSKEEGLTR